MNKDLLEFIDSFNKEKEQYTQEEIYQIGMKHKALPANEKSWQEVVDAIGWSGTPESLRSYINRMSKQRGTLSKNNRELNSRTIDDITVEDLVQAKQELLVQQQKTRDEIGSYKRLIRSVARVETMRDAIAEAISKLENLPVVKTPNTCNSNNTTEAILLLSDLHIGVECNNFYNTYNTQVASERLNKLTQDVIKYCSDNHVQVLNVLNLGDMIHGIIHTNARIEQEMDVVNQLVTASELVARTLNSLRMAAPTIKYRSCTDNHSRAIADKHEAIEQENFSRLMDWMLQERLKDTNIQFITDNIDVGIGKFKLINGKTVMFAHGHNDNINQAFQHFVGATKEFIDYICLGHYHCEKSKSYQGSKVIVNGSIVGTEQYALSKRLFSEPSQLLLVFDNSNTITISINLSTH